MQWKLVLASSILRLMGGDHGSITNGNIWALRGGFGSSYMAWAVPFFLDEFIDMPLRSPRTVLAAQIAADNDYFLLNTSSYFLSRINVKSTDFADEKIGILIKPK
jgi:hypothetical protein